ncbi:hypothetical protein MGG_02539 [Pyricularia oryzae 70-15]|uniref:Nudix hydrolase domain-containing protein n=3 Tax=Pyricularia oryzae TaxID=318829 RepID=G4NK35_PYRO7|nr:uncharacterized protein MGG_02539 [Pyricularia oryzae 70-15]EHA46520.1 hypothetical protein MGG_02539 [Pyricularia oryzae 70-15]ELQ34260.1 hypothetical protein OOU_Y34scaffold00777g18 [Pyricularia oryzae Y34]KAI7918502.1 hypothetical protein M9X92_006851 [Pyricularia oryzae]KAI7919368.1 hypothetical protein M0657_007144 [Pyricularia oryzae]
MDIAVPNKKLKMDSSDATIPSVASLLARIAELEQELVQTKLVHQSQVFKPRCNGLDRKPSSITGMRTGVTGIGVQDEASKQSNRLITRPQRLPSAEASKCAWNRYLLRKPEENTHPATTSVEAALECARKNNLDMEEIDRTMFWRPSYETTISCGFVAVDLKHHLVLSIYNKKLGIYQLPKGRTQINESFLKAAMRETIEESGVVVTPLPLLNWTRANPEDDGDATQTNGSSRQKSPPVVQACPDKQVVSDTLNNEFIGVVEYMDPQVSTPNTHKSIYYFAASFDVEAHEAGTEGKCYEEKFIPCAYSLEDTLKVLRFQADRDAVTKLVDDLRLTSIAF